MQYLEDDYHPQRRLPTYREETTYAPAPQPYPAQDEYDDDEEEFDDVYEEENEDEYDDRPAPRDRCAFYGLTPGTAAHHDCQKQLHKQKRNRYYRR